MIRYLAALLLVLMLTPVQAGAVSTSAASAVLMDADSGRILYEQNADQQMLIASTTKIMTALVAIRDGNLSDVVKVSREAAYTEGSSMYLKEGERLTLETLLYGLMLCSGNDAAVAIAQHVGGSVDAFVKRMNETAAELGMTATSFANPNGLDHEMHHSTARDMAVLACAAMENETIARIVSTQSVHIGGRTMTNHNKLLSYQKGCIGLKTGYTKAAGRTLVSCTEQNGQRLIAVTLQDGNDWADHQTLVEYGFSTYPSTRLAVLGTTVTTVKTADGTEVPLIATERFSWPLKDGETVKKKLKLTQPLMAPISAGTSVGEMIYFLEEQEIGRVELVCGRTVPPNVEPAWKNLKLYLSE